MRGKKTYTAGALGVLAFWVFGAMEDDWIAASRDMAAMLIIAAVVRVTLRSAVRTVMQPQADVYEAGVQQGYDHGYHDGRRSARPIVVPIRIPDDASQLVN